MAAPERKTEVDSSSSEDETLKKCREAVWETQANKRKDGDNGVNKSKRVVADHEHNGNELQVTRGFQTHVAKKLEHFLDSCISEMQPETSHGLESTKCDNDNQEEGFRLFSTSVLGQKVDCPPAPVRRRPAPSSSDSESEMESRLKEAAVSIKDLLPSHRSTSSPSSKETPGSERKQKKKQVEEQSQIIRKKKKKEIENDEEQEQVDSAGSAPDQSSGERRNSEQENIKVKRKKKKKQKRSEEETLS